jgi:DNA polymerase II small subunit/DNA polymerase delta subunit B
MMNCDPQNAFKGEDPAELEAAILTLQMRHLCPTAPDTMRVFPFKESDPFVIADKDLTLEDQEEKAIHTEVPHVYFTANAPKYSTKLIK